MTARLRCDDVTRELAAPTAGGDPSAVAAHLAACPACASWAAGDARLTRLWDATRPAEPAAETWDALWADVSARLDQARALDEMPDVIALAPRRGMRWALRAFISGQAAALLVGIGGLIAARGPAVVQAAPAEVQIDAGQVALISEDARGVHTVVLNTDVGPNAVEPDFMILNALEAMAE